MPLLSLALRRQRHLLPELRGTRRCSRRRCPTRAGSSSRRSGTWPRSSSASPTARSKGRSSRAADFALAPDDGVVFSHHTLLWARPGTHLEPWSKGSFFNRTYAGMPLVLMRASGPGHVALSEDHPGEVVALPIPAGRGFLVREHSFLAATDNVDFTWLNSPVWLRVQKGNDTEYEYPIGPYIDHFNCGQSAWPALAPLPGQPVRPGPRAGPVHPRPAGFLGLLRHLGQFQPPRRVPRRPAASGGAALSTGRSGCGSPGREGSPFALFSKNRNATLAW